MQQKVKQAHQRNTAMQLHQTACLDLVARSRVQKARGKSNHDSSRGLVTFGDTDASPRTLLSPGLRRLPRQRFLFEKKRDSYSSHMAPGGCGETRPHQKKLTKQRSARPSECHSPRSLRTSFRSLGDISIFKSSAGIRPSLVALFTSAPACTRASIAPTRPHRHAK